MEGYKKHTRCLVSGSDDLRPLKGYEKHYLVRSHPLGFVFCSRIPTAEELSAHYDTYGRDDYYSPLTRKRYHELLDTFEPYRQTNKILDVGCGIGYFLEEAIAKGWDAYGTEYSDRAVEICSGKGIKMRQGKLDDAWFEKDSFDVVTSFEVIEHINDPVEEVKKIHRMLRSGGLFYLTTPNFNAIERYILKSEYNIIVYPEHLSYYTPHTLDYLLSRNGFRKIYLQTTGVSISRILSSSRPGKISTESKPVSPVTADEKIRNTLESSKALSLAKGLVNRMLTVLGTGNSIKALYIKV